MIVISPFCPEHQQGVQDLVLTIQSREFGIPITLEEQPDLMDISGFCQNGKGNFWVALSGTEVVGTIALLDIGKNLGVLRKNEWRVLSARSQAFGGAGAACGKHQVAGNGMASV